MGTFRVTTPGFLRFYLIICFKSDLLSTEKPTYVRFQDLNETILEEFSIKENGSTGGGRDFKVFGIWQGLIGAHKKMLASGAMKVSVSFEDDAESESSLIGTIHRNANKGLF